MHIVTGGAGFIGSAIIAKLNEEGITDIVVVDELGTSAKWKNLVNRSYADYLHKDHLLELLESGALDGHCDSIIHMGACSSTTEENGDYLMENNYRYTCHLAEYCASNEVRFIYASSAATYGDGEYGYSDDEESFSELRPLNRYGYSKQLFDLWAARNEYTDSIAGLKFFNVYGPNEYHKGDMRSVVHKAYQQIKDTGEVKLFKSYRDEYGDGEQKRDFVYVKDCADVVWELLQDPEINGVFNLGTGTARSWNDLATAVFSALGKKPKIKYIDMPEELRDQYQYFTEAEMSKLAESGCETSFRSLEDGVKDYVQSYLEEKDQYI